MSRTISDRSSSLGIRPAFQKKSAASTVCVGKELPRCSNGTRWCSDYSVALRPRQRIPERPNSALKSEFELLNSIGDQQRRGEEDQTKVEVSPLRKVNRIGIVGPIRSMTRRLFCDGAQDHWPPKAPSTAFSEYRPGECITQAASELKKVKPHPNPSPPHPPPATTSVKEGWSTFTTISMTLAQRGLLRSRTAGLERKHKNGLDSLSNGLRVKSTTTVRADVGTVYVSLRDGSRALIVAVSFTCRSSQE